MEVHAHSHTARKKWTHYLWEFLMLFLAVFCGFLAENQREHMVEHTREKEFMRSMVDDLHKDSAAINLWIKRLELNQKNIDSAVKLYSSLKNIREADVLEIGRVGSNGLTNIGLVFTDRTTSQLKNSGSMRLIRNKTVADSLIEYWSRIDGFQLSQVRVESYRLDGRKAGFKIFGSPAGSYIHQFIDSSFLINAPGILSNSPLLLGEYMNYLVIIGQTYRNQYQDQLKNLFHLSQSLINIIEREYQLK